MPASAKRSPEPLLASVLDTIGEEIVSGEHSEGDTFTLHDLSQRFDISRTVAREAMRALEQLGLVSSSRRVGLKVLPQSEWNVFDHSIITWRLRSAEQRPAQITSLRELRDAIEPSAARLAATHATPAEARELCALADRLVELTDQASGNSEEFLEADARFHSLLLIASRNEMFVQLTHPIIGVLIGRSEYGIMPDDPERETMQIHVELAEAVANGEPDRAEDASRRLLRGVNEFMEI